MLARSDLGSLRRTFTGLSLVERACGEVHGQLADPRNYPAIYPMVKQVRVRSEGKGVVNFVMFSDTGVGKISQRFDMRRLPDRVLDSTQANGHSTWHFIEVGVSACLLHFTHDEDLGDQNLLMRAALAQNDALREGIQATTAVTNVRNVRVFTMTDPGAILGRRRVQEALGRLTRYGAVAFLPADASLRVQLAAASKASPASLMDEAVNSERWSRYLSRFHSGVGRDQPSARGRRLVYQAGCLAETVQFETWQQLTPRGVKERVIAGDISTGGWDWEVVETATGSVLHLTIGLPLADGDWLLRRLVEVDRQAARAVDIGLAFLLVERVARAAR